MVLLIKLFTAYVFDLFPDDFKTQDHAKLLPSLIFLFLLLT